MPAEIKAVTGSRTSKGPYSENAGKNKSSYRIENEQRLLIPYVTKGVLYIPANEHIFPTMDHQVLTELYLLKMIYNDMSV